MNKTNEIAIVPQPQTIEVKAGDKINNNKYLLNKLKEVIETHGETNYPYVLEYIQNEIEESTRIIAFNYNFKCFREDGAYALDKSIKKIIGYTKQQNEKTPSGSNPPKMLNISFLSGKNLKVPFGKINLPNYGDGAFIDMHYDLDNQEMYVKGQCEKRYVEMLDQIIDNTKECLKTDSIYKNQAIKISNIEESPEFINLSSINNTNLYLTPSAKLATEPIEARIEKTQMCIDKNIDIRFGVLLAGSYGVGKSLYAFKLANKAILNGWGFLYCSDPQNILYCMKIANMLADNAKGIVLFVEDADQVLNVRNNKTNEISLMMDGGETKSKNVITILTTNHPELIDPTFLRGKRIGSLVKLGAPDKQTAKKMIEGTMVDETGMSILENECDEAALMIEKEQIVPAFIMEILDRVKSHLIYRDKQTITCEDIISSIISFKEQMNIAGLKDVSKSDADLFYDGFKKLLNTDQLNEIQEKIESVDDYLRG